MRLSLVVHGWFKAVFSNKLVIVNKFQVFYGQVFYLLGLEELLFEIG